MATLMKNIQIDLRDVPCMPLDVRRLLTSDTWLAAADDTAVGYALMTLWMQSWHQVPAGSLPASDAVLARLAMCDMTTWTRIKSAALAGWTIADDGRYHHNVIGEKAVECDEARAKKLAFAQVQRTKGIASAAARALAKPAEQKAAKSLPSAMESDVSHALVKIDVAEDSSSAGGVAVAKIDNAQIVFDFWKDTMKSKRSLLDAKRRKLINQRLKDGYTVEDLMTAIMGCSKTPHNMGETNGTLYNTIELILRDSSFIDRFMSTALGTKDLFSTSGGELSAAGRQSMSALDSVFGNSNAPGFLMEIDHE